MADFDLSTRAQGMRQVCSSAHRNEHQSGRGFGAKSKADCFAWSYTIVTEYSCVIGVLLSPHAGVELGRARLDELLVASRVERRSARGRYLRCQSGDSDT